MIRREATGARRADNRWFYCPGPNPPFTCNDFECLPDTLLSPSMLDGVTEQYAELWFKAHKLTYESAGVQPECPKCDDGTKVGARKPGEATFVCPRAACRKTVPIDGPAVNNFEQSGYKDIWAVMMAWASLVTMESISQFSGLSEGTSAKKVRRVESVMATWMRHHASSVRRAIEESGRPCNVPREGVSDEPLTLDSTSLNAFTVADSAAREINPNNTRFRVIQRQVTADHVEADEIFFSTPKNGVGHAVSESGPVGFQTLVVVGADRKIMDFAMRPVEDRSRDTLYGFLLETIPPGTVLATDSWKGYVRLDEFDHYKVNHSAQTNRYVDPETGATTNAVESIHRLIRAMMAPRNWSLGVKPEGRLNRVMANGCLALGSLRAINGNRRRWVFKCFQDVAKSGVAMWEPKLENAQTIPIPPAIAATTNPPSGPVAALTRRHERLREDFFMMLPKWQMCFDALVRHGLITVDEANQAHAVTATIAQGNESEAVGAMLANNVARDEADSPRRRGRPPGVVRARSPPTPVFAANAANAAARAASRGRGGGSPRGRGRARTEE